MAQILDIDSHHMVGVINDKKDTWLQTWRGNKVSVLNPTEEEVDVNDIASGIAKICRFNGNIVNFYSVAQHSVIGSRLALKLYGTERAKEVLLHDAAEHRIGDLIRPVKVHFPEYEALDNKHYSTIASKFGLPLEMTPECKYIDNVMVTWEKRDLMPGVSEWPNMPDISRYNFPTIRCWTWQRAEREWLKMYRRLF